MNASEEQPFRLDNESLAFRFTATLTDRHGVTLERLATPKLLGLWWRLNGLAIENASFDENDLRQARLLRESIHRVGTCVATRTDADVGDVAVLNEFSRAGAADLILDEGQARWEVSTTDANQTAMRIVAQDAVLTFGGENAERVRTCERDECRGLFIDTSRAGNRRWCSMNTCGNREKKAQMKKGVRGRHAAAR